MERGRKRERKRECLEYYYLIKQRQITDMENNIKEGLHLFSAYRGCEWTRRRQEIVLLGSFQMKGLTEADETEIYTSNQWGQWDRHREITDLTSLHQNEPGRLKWAVQPCCSSSTKLRLKRHGRAKLCIKYMTSVCAIKVVIYSNICMPLEMVANPHNPPCFLAFSVGAKKPESWEHMAIAILMDVFKCV